MKTEHFSTDKIDTEMKELTDELNDLLIDCQKCKMCVRACPTYEGWYTQSPYGRLMAISYYLKYGTGTEKELSDLLFTCTTCGRCKSICKLMSGGAKSSDIIVRARNLLVMKAHSKQEKK